MTEVEQIIYKKAKVLSDKLNISIDVAHLEVSVLLSHSLNIKRSKLITISYDKLNKDILNRFNSFIERRLKNEPIAYITTTKEFYGNNFYVDDNVLIPRPETEELIDITKEYIFPKANILDVGSGSGAIAITLKYLYADTNITAIDISEKAINVAKKNMLSILKENSIDFINSDFFKFRAKNKFDIIVSNPPYVGLLEKNDLNPSLMFEPDISLFSGEYGLDFISKSATYIKSILKENGVLIMEIGERQGEDVKDIFSELEFNVCLVKDLSGKDRFLVARA